MQIIDKSLLRSIRDGFFVNVLWSFAVAGASLASSYIAWQKQATAVAGLLGFFAVIFAVATFFVSRAAYSIHQSYGSPKYKIVLEAFPAIVHPEGKDFAIIPRLKLVNHGGFPVQVDSTNSKWSVSGNTGEERIDKNKVGVVSPHGWLWLAGPKFPIPSPQDGVAEVTGNVSVDLKYGLPDKMHYSYVATYKLVYLYYPSLKTEGSLSLVNFERFA